MFAMYPGNIIAKPSSLIIHYLGREFIISFPDIGKFMLSVVYIANRIIFHLDLCVCLNNLIYTVSRTQLSSFM